MNLVDRYNQKQQYKKLEYLSYLRNKNIKFEDLFKPEHRYIPEQVDIRPYIGDRLDMAPYIGDIPPQMETRITNNNQDTRHRANNVDVFIDGLRIGEVQSITWSESRPTGRLH